MTRHNRKTRYEKHDKLSLLGDRRGAVAVWAVLMMVAMLGVTALALDMGYLWMLKNRLQATADATALAGAALLTPLAPTPNVDAVMFPVKKTAVEFADKNMPALPHGKVLCTAGGGRVGGLPGWPFRRRAGTLAW